MTQPLKISFELEGESWQLMLRLGEAIGGPEARKIMVALKDLGEATDEEIARQARLSINTTRRILYKLADARLVTSRAVKDTARGWITHFWHISSENLHPIIELRKKKVLEKLQKRLAYETSDSFFYCGTPGCPRYTFSQAIENRFECPICKNPLKQFDNSRIIKVLRYLIKVLSED